MVAIFSVGGVCLCGGVGCFFDRWFVGRVCVCVSAAFMEYLGYGVHVHYFAVFFFRWAVFLRFVVFFARCTQGPLHAYIRPCFVSG